MTTNFLKIDGSTGEGGGQILRTALSLSMITGTPIHLSNIRANRKKQGLMRQHLACVDASRDISNAIVVGNELGSTELYFSPNAVKAGNYHFNIGSSGSTMLVFQTLLPALILQDSSSTIIIEGGTHNPLAPTADFVKKCFMTTLAKLGIQLELEIIRAGFAPIGGGKVKATIHAWHNRLPLELVNAENLTAINAYAGCLNLENSIAKRELTTLAQELRLSQSSTYHLSGISQGNSVFVETIFDNHTQVFTALGEFNKSAEKVAKILAKTVKEYLASHAACDEYLTDQLLLPMALGKGGRFTAQVISEHTKTQAIMIEKFLPVRITFLAQDKCHLVEVKK